MTLAQVAILALLALSTWGVIATALEPDKPRWVRTVITVTWCWLMLSDLWKFALTYLGATP